MSKVIAVTGGRHYKNRQLVYQTLDRLLPGHDTDAVIIHGGATGADSLAADWAHTRGVHTAVVDALWWKFDRSAGPIRNNIIAKLKPDILIAFPGGPGTGNMIRQAHEQGIMVERIEE